MKPRQSLLSRIAALFRRRRVVKPAPIAPQRPPKESKVRGIEPLEGRVAPATLIDAQTISFNDLDGDVVTVHFSKAFLTASSAGDIFKFSDGTTASAFSSTGPQQLQLIDLNRVPVNLDTFISKAEGTSLSVTAVKGAGGIGDDLTNVGQIKGTNLALGSVVIDGDLGQIDCGRSGAKVGLKSLVVNSLYQFGSTTQLAGNATEQLESKIGGELTSLEVKTDLYGYIHVVDATGLSATMAAKIGSVKVAGLQRGNISDNTGTIESARGIGTVTVGGLVGSGGKNSGSIVSAAGISSITVGFGGLTGDAGVNSGAIVAGGGLPLVKIAGDVTGGGGIGSGSIRGALLTKGTISGKLTGGAGAGSGAVDITKTIASLTITGDVLGGGGAGSGGVEFGSAFPYTTVPGSLPPTTITLGGKLTGGSGFASGAIHGETSLAVVKVVGDVTGGIGDRSGAIISDGTASVVSIGKLIGGAGANSGTIFTGADPLLKGNLGTVTIANGLLGGGGISSGSIIASKIGSVRVVAGGAAGAGGDFSGSIFSTSSIRSVAITGGLTDSAILAGRDIAAATIAGNVTNSTISAVGQAVVDPLLGDLAIAKLTINGSVSGSRILAGYDILGAAMNADASLGPVLVTGDWTASDIVAGVQDSSGDGFGDADDSKIIGVTDRAGFISKIASIVINGTVGGTAGGTDQFAFTAQRILAFKSGGVITALTPGTGNDDKPIGATGDVRIHEVAL